MTAPTKDPALDRVRIAGALAKLRTMPPTVEGMKADAMERFEHAALDIAFACMAEAKRRKETPRGRARLRLVAEDGELTEAGMRVVRARKGARARWR